MGELGQKLTALTCFYQKPHGVMWDVLEALEHADELIVVADRPSQETAAFLELRPSLAGKRFFLGGPPGWRSPCVSWNAGLEHVTGDNLLIIQGDVILEQGAIQRIKALLSDRPAAYFGKVIESAPMKGPGHAGPVLCSSANPRPLTYLLGVPTAAVKAINGWDEAFQAGVWFEDNDFTARLWKHGLDFVFDDKFSGIHQSHDRPYADSYKIGINRSIFVSKHGTDDFFTKQQRLGKLGIFKQEGRTIWSHV